MVFLLHAARRLGRPAPDQLLRRHHPLFRWTGEDDLASWQWRNARELDRSMCRS
jgi:hypothetical protein